MISKKRYYAVLLVGCIVLAYFCWLFLRPVEIVAIHRNDNHSYVLVKNFPLTDNGKINWWLENKSRLKRKCDIPQPDANGFFTIVFWDFGDGYKEEGKYERLCFDDMPPPVNCIDKDKVFTVSNSRNLGITFLTNDNYYMLNKSGKLVKQKFS
ncbi:DUF943 family protein [Enterobacteriaceae bacterium ESL0689]|nr:DUF943 family protein [Enterobacteriaceae bacterium ESL0689]